MTSTDHVQRVLTAVEADDAEALAAAVAEARMWMNAEVSRLRREIDVIDGHRVLIEQLRRFVSQTNAGT